MSTYTHFIKNMNTVTEACDIVKQVVQNIIDLGDGKATYAAADVLTVLKVPVNATVVDFGCNIITADGSAGTADFGDVADDNGFDDNVALDAAQGTATRMVAADAYSAGRVYLPADANLVADRAGNYVAINATLAGTFHATTHAKFRVWVEYVFSLKSMATGL